MQKVNYPKKRKRYENIFRTEVKIRNGKLNSIAQKTRAKGKEEWCKHYNENTFRNHIKKIEGLGINILTFDIEIDGEKIKAEVIKNFTALENGVKDINSKGELPNDNG